jgi:hypothetical protein
VPIFLSIPNYIAVDIVPNEVTINETNGESGPNGNLIFTTKNITKYVINFNELAMSNDRFFKSFFREYKHGRFQDLGRGERESYNHVTKNKTCVVQIVLFCFIRKAKLYALYPTNYTIKVIKHRLQHIKYILQKLKCYNFLTIFFT